MRLKNLTPHPVVLGEGENQRVIPPAGRPARLMESYRPLGDVEGIPLFEIIYSDPLDLPPPQEGRLLIVSALMREVLHGRMDLVSPCQLVRDSNGYIRAARGLCGSAWAEYWVEHEEA